MIQPPGSVAVQDERRFLLRGRHVALWFAAWLLAAALLWLAARGVDWRGAIVAIQRARHGWLIVAIAANLAILALWASLWRLVLPRGIRVTWPRMFEIASVTSAIMNTIPALVGHASAVGLLVRRGGMPLRAAGAVITLDQVGEGVSKLAVIAIALAVVDLPDWMRGGAFSVALAVAALLAAVIAVAAIGGTAFGDTRAGRLFDEIRDDLHAIRSPARAASALVVALAMKAAEAAAIACVIGALGLDLPFGAAFVVLAATNLATMLPVAPGNVGTYEAGAVAAYRLLGVSPEMALAAAVVQHACFLIPAVGAGVVWLAGGVVRADRRPGTAA